MSSSSHHVCYGRIEIDGSSSPSDADGDHDPSLRAPLCDTIAAQHESRKQEKLEHKWGQVMALIGRGRITQVASSSSSTPGSITGEDAAAEEPHVNDCTPTSQSHPRPRRLLARSEQETIRISDGIRPNDVDVGSTLRSAPSSPASLGHTVLSDNNRSSSGSGDASSNDDNFEAQGGLQNDAPERAPAWSQGAEHHAQRECKPCVHYWKADSCRRGAECLFCHLCSAEDVRKKNKRRVTLTRAKKRRERRATKHEQQDQNSVSAAIHTAADDSVDADVGDVPLMWGQREAVLLPSVRPHHAAVMAQHGDAAHSSSSSFAVPADQPFIFVPGAVGGPLAGSLPPKLWMESSACRGGLVPSLLPIPVQHHSMALVSGSARSGHTSRPSSSNVTSLCPPTMSLAYTSIGPSGELLD
mmetsp:Transcript_27894/g.64813  ORF Transcript_27894/g.64813 Transcript_27894/m.64813 type:complete len:413 (-) Transcript_27894:132-1370(-)